MPRSRQQSADNQIRIEWELESLELWKAKTRGVRSYEWDGNELILTTERGREVFDRPTVESVIFANFRPETTHA